MGAVPNLNPKSSSEFEGHRHRAGHPVLGGHSGRLREVRDQEHERRRWGQGFVAFFIFFFFGEGLAFGMRDDAGARACRFSFLFLFGLGLRMRDDAGPSVYCFL